MSKYSNIYDFRDMLKEVYDDSWEDFLTRTEGIIYQVTEDESDIEEIIIECPSELIKYYGREIVMILTFTKDDVCNDKIVIQNTDYIDITMNMYDVFNEKYGNTGFEPFRTKELYEIRKELDDLYERESTKSYEDQRIV